MTPRKGGGGGPGPAKTKPSTGIGINLEPELPKDTGLDDRARLVALRGVLEAILNDPDTPPRDIAAVSREYRQCISVLAHLAPPSAGTRLDEIAARRRKRGAQ